MNSPGAFEVPLIPAGARGPAVPASGYLVDEVAGGVHWITDGGYQCAFVVHDHGVVAIDAPPCLGGLVTRAIRDVTDKPITHVVYSHFHGDHIGGVDQFPTEAIRVAHQDTWSKLAEAGDPARQLPDVTFADSCRIEVGGQVLDLVYRGDNHAPGNIFIHAPQHRVLMLVDVIYPGWVPFTNIAQSKNIPGFMAHHDHALEFDFDTMITGHLTRLGTREDVEVQREYMHDIRQAAQHALEITAAKREIARAEVGVEHIYRYFKTMYEAAAAEAAKPVLDKWLGRLGGVDTLGINHTLTMYHSLRLDENAKPSVVFFPPAADDGCVHHDH